MRSRRHLWLGLLGIVLFAVVFLVPFAFVVFTAAKTRTEAGELQFSLPTTGPCSRTSATPSGPATTC